MRERELKAQIYQFRVELAEVKPAVWRRILVRGNQSFWGLHVAIQDAMGWLDCHLHEFEMMDPKTSEVVHFGIPDPDGQFPEDYDVLPGWEENIARYFSLENRTAEYSYDFGDGWTHSVELEKIFPAVPRRKYPKCVGGEMRCPPEDVGGPWGYSRFLDAILDSRHPEHQEMKQWAGGSFSPTGFNPEHVVFDNPDARLKYAFEDDPLYL